MYHAGRTDSRGIYGLVYSLIGGFAHGIGQNIGRIGGYRGRYARRGAFNNSKRASRPANAARILSIFSARPALAAQVRNAVRAMIVACSVVVCV